MKNNHLSTEFSRFVKAQRIKQRLTPEELATCADVHRTTIGLIEKATIDVAEAIAQGLGYSLSNALLTMETYDGNKTTKKSEKNGLDFFSA